MTETEKALVLESIEFWHRQQHNRKIKEHFENLGFRVEVIELPYSCSINDSILVNGIEYIKIGYNFINTRKAYCIACEIPEFNIEEQNSELEIDLEEEAVTQELAAILPACTAANMETSCRSRCSIRCCSRLTLRNLRKIS